MEIMINYARALHEATKEILRLQEELESKNKTILEYKIKLDISKRRIDRTKFSDIQYMNLFGNR